MIMFKKFVMPKMTLLYNKSSTLILECPNIIICGEILIIHCSPLIRSVSCTSFAMMVTLMLWRVFGYPRSFLEFNCSHIIQLTSLHALEACRRSSPLIGNASCMSLGMKVTLFAWITHKFTSSTSHMLNNSTLSCKANTDVA